MSVEIPTTRPPGRFNRLLHNLRTRFTRMDDPVPLSNRGFPPKKTEPKVKERCMICNEKGTLKSPLLRPCSMCSGAWCSGCIRERFLHAMKTPAEMPPRCCQTFLPHVGLDLLGPEDQKKFQRAWDEHRTEVKNRVYCPNVDCGKHISQYEVRKQKVHAGNVEDKGKKRDSGVENEAAPNDMVVCPDCNTEICMGCKTKTHPGSPCVETEDEEMVAQIRKWGYKRCPRCGHGVRRMWGCSHMECPCGAHFCWHCGKNYTVCEILGGCHDEVDEDEMTNSDDEDDEEMEDTDGDTIPEGCGESRAGNRLVDDAVVADAVVTDVAVENGTDTVAMNVESAATGEANAAEIPDDNNDAPKVVLTPPSPKIEAEPSTQTPETTATSSDNTPARPANLDRGTHHYWERQDLDFGEEPGDIEGEEIWGCTHSFQDRVPGEHTQSQYTKYWCWHCWEAIGETRKECWVCYLVRCEKCVELFKEKEDGEEVVVGEVVVPVVEGGEVVVPVMVGEAAISEVLVSEAAGTVIPVTPVLPVGYTGAGM